MTTKRDLPADLSTDLSAEARSARVDRLDTAIDQVTARMVQVRDDQELALRIASALPERASRFSWLIPQFAAIAAFAIAAVVWTLRDPTPSLSPLPSSGVVAVTGVPITVVAVEPGTALRTKPLEHLEPLEPLEPVEPMEPLRLDGADHERGLPAIESLTALVLTDVSPDELPATSPLALAPIDITELPLTSDSFPPR